MNYDLYFIPIITEALKASNKTEAIKDAFAKIEQLGQEQPYQRGYRQFCMLMHEVNLAQEQIDGDAIERRLIDYFGNQHTLHIIIEKDQAILKTLEFSFEGSSAILKDICPGSYRVALAGGLGIWQDRLTEADVFLHKTPGESNLKMAADTEGAEPQPSRIESPLGGAVELSLYPGFHAGSIKITVQKLRI